MNLALNDNSSSQRTPDQFFFARRIFFAALGLIYACAFLSLAVQIVGLVGSGGILPAASFLRQVSSHLGAEGFWSLPTLFWFNSGDGFLLFLCWAGAGLGILLALGVAPIPVSLLLWIFYLSLFSVGNVFLGFQWDILLLETGFLAIFLAPFGWGPGAFRQAPPSKVILWLLRWLLFRLMFQSGMVKLLSGDPVWFDLTALTNHYQTQPLPTWVAYYASQCPLWFQKISCGMMFGIELVVPFFIFAPRVFRRTAGLILVGFQVLIMLTGNYGFFNLLTIALCLLLFDDGVWSRLLRKKILEERPPVSSQVRNWSPWITGVLAALILFLSLGPSERRLFRNYEWPDWYLRVAELFEPFHLVNGYGLFADMTTERREITIEGSVDGVEWREYEFRYKPGKPWVRPDFVEPHMPRLDWQMWFAALAPYRPRSWFQIFLLRLLEGSPEVLKFFKNNPFPQGPPKYLRSTIAEYQFTNLETKRETGRWWEIGEAREFSPVMLRKDP